MTSVRLATGVVEALLAEAARCAPAECCGLLLGAEDAGRGAVGDVLVLAILPAANVAPDPARYFEIDPATLISAHRSARAGGPAVLGWYHSHPSGESVPSEADREAAPRDGRIWAIIGAGTIGFWRDGVAGFEPLSSGAADG